MIDIRDECFLHKQYVEQKKSIQCIADEFSTTYKKIRYWLIKGSIPLRTLSEALSLRRLSEEHKQKLSEAHKGDKAYNWQGDNTSYKNIHLWLGRNKPKGTVCEICGKDGKLESSCKDHIYTRDMNNYQWVHRKCHREYDKNFDFQYPKSLNF